MKLEEHIPEPVSSVGFTDELWLSRRRETRGDPALQAQLAPMPGAEPPRPPDEYVIETISGKEVAVVLPASSPNETRCNARLVEYAPRLFRSLRECVGQHCASCPHFSSYWMTCSSEEDCMGKRWLNTLRLAAGADCTATKEQLEACRQYISVIEAIQTLLDMREEFSGSYSSVVPYELERRRAEAHDRLIRAYGFQEHSDTWDITGGIPRGMAPSELHERLRRLAEKEGKKD